jgi:ATP-dependent Lon protease
LIIEQDEDMLDLLEDEIKEMGPSVTAATGEQSAILEAAGRRFDVVIAEVGISRAMGPEFLANLKRLLPGALIVAMTSFGTEATIREAFRKGADYYMAKPIQMESLKDFISHLGKERMKFLGNKDPLERWIAEPGGDID